MSKKENSLEVIETPAISTLQSENTVAEESHSKDLLPPLDTAWVIANYDKAKSELEQHTAFHDIAPPTPLNEEDTEARARIIRALDMIMYRLISDVNTPIFLESTLSYLIVRGKMQPGLESLGFRVIRDEEGNLKIHYNREEISKIGKLSFAGENVKIHYASDEISKVAELSVVLEAAIREFCEEEKKFWKG